MDDIAIKVDAVSKYYKLYKSSGDRLKEALNPFGKKYHKDFYALKNIDLEVKKGEILGIIGLNGSGKSTLLKLITGVLTPTSGKVVVSGNISALLELGSGFNPDFTGLQNIYFYGIILGYSKNKVREKLDEILKFADIGEFIHQPLKTYSSGMKSRLGFAVAVNVEPDILILDEVLAVGDAGFQRKCYAKIDEMFSKGCTVILVSHNDQAIAKMCTRVILLNDHQLVLSGKPKDVLLLYQDLTLEKDRSRRNGDINKPIPVNSKPDEMLSVSESDIYISEVKVIDKRGDTRAIVNCRESIWVALVIKYNFSQQQEVCLAFNIRDVQGVVMGGGVIEDVTLNGEGTTAVSKEIFQSFAPGKYFITGTCNKKVNGEWGIADRRQDAVFFEIKEWPEDGYWGSSYLAPLASPEP